MTLVEIQNQNTEEEWRRNSERRKNKTERQKASKLKLPESLEKKESVMKAEEKAMPHYLYHSNLRLGRWNQWKCGRRNLKKLEKEINVFVYMHNRKQPKESKESSTYSRRSCDDEASGRNESSPISSRESAGS